jgi:hypothetical protein
MQIPCREKDCLPTIETTWNNDKCPGNNSSKHCVDCHGFCSEDYQWTSRCSMCKNYWCYGSLRVFAYLENCDHKFTPTEQQTKTWKPLESGVCPSCFLSTPVLQCSEQDCPHNYDIFLLNWIDFCKSPISLGTYTIQTTGEYCKRFQVFLRRVPHLKESLTKWTVDTTRFYYTFGPTVKTYTSIEELIKQAKEDILSVAKTQTVSVNQAYATSQGFGVLNKRKLFSNGFRDRDASPERKQKK